MQLIWTHAVFHSSYFFLHANRIWMKIGVCGRGGEFDIVSVGLIYFYFYF